MDIPSCDRVKFNHRLAAALLLVLAAAGCKTATVADPPMGGDPDEFFALEFDGVDDVLEVPDAPALDLTDEATVSAWYYHVGAPSGELGLVQKDGPGSWGRWGFWVDEDTILFCVFIASGMQECVESVTMLTRDEWTHLSGTYDGAQLRLYLDGQLDTEMVLTGSISTSDGSLFIGADPTEPLFTAGRLDEVCVWNIARTQAEIQASMNMKMLGTETGLVGLWRMDEGMGQTVLDASPNGLTATLGTGAGADSGDPVWVTTTWPHS